MLNAYLRSLITWYLREPRSKLLRGMMAEEHCLSDTLNFPRNIYILGLKKEFVLSVFGYACWHIARVFLSSYYLWLFFNVNAYITRKENTFLQHTFYIQRGICWTEDVINVSTYAFRTFLVVQMIKNLPWNAGDPGLIPGSEWSPGERMDTHASILAWT